MLLFSSVFSAMKHSGQDSLPSLHSHCSSSEVLLDPWLGRDRRRSFWNSQSWESTVARTMRYQCCLLETPGTIITKETFPCRLLTKAFLLESTIFSKCLKEKDYKNRRSMRGPGMSGPPVLPGKNLYTVVLYNNNKLINNNDNNINNDNNNLL